MGVLTWAVRRSNDCREVLTSEEWFKVLGIRHAILFLLTSCIGSACLGVASGSDLSEFLHNVFEDKYQRSPTGTDLNYHASLTRNQGPLENYIAIFGSDEYFVNRAQRNYDVYVTQLYQTFLGRNPRQDELRYWVVQFQRAGVNRREMVRRFCQANLVTQLPSNLPSPPTFRPPATAPAIGAELVSRANLFVSFVQNEVGYSSYGQQVVRQGRQFAAVAEQYRQVVANPRSTRQQVRIAIDNLERSLQTLESQFHRVSGASPHSQSILQQLSQLVSAARTTPIGLPEQPIAPPVTAPGYAELIVLRDAVRQFAYTVQAWQYRGPDYANLYRDVQGLLVQVEAVELMVRQSQSRYEIRRAMRNVITQADHTSSNISRVDMSLQQTWWKVQVQLRQASQAMGLRSTNPVQPSYPVIVNRPSWSQLPFQPVPRRPSLRNQQTIRIADELTNKIDAYIASLNSIWPSNVNANKLIGSLQNLKHSTRRRAANCGQRGFWKYTHQVQRPAYDSVPDYRSRLHDTSDTRLNAELAAILSDR